MSISGKLKWILLLLAVSAWAVPARGDSATVPGDVNSLCYHDNFFYNLPQEDFFYYFNDALLYSEPPDDAIYSDGMRDKFLRLVRRHALVKAFVLANGNRQNATLSLDLKTEKGFVKAVEFMTLLGLELKKGANETLRIQPADEEFPIQYYAFCRLKSAALQEQLQRSGIFFFKLQETAVRLPWELHWLEALTGLKLAKEDFFEQMIANKRFSLLLAVLFRISEREVAFIAQQKDASGVSGWKRIYQDKKLLMGMLVLSSALRVRDNRLFLPGGDKARKFWAALAGGDPDRAPFDFVTKLCGLDGGKLNYLYVFSFFLPEEDRRVLFFDYDPVKVGRLYRKIILGDNEKIKANSLPRLENFTFYSLLLALKTSGGRIDLPLGSEPWARALGLELTAGSDDCDFLEALLAATGRPSGKMNPLRKFIGIYSKFSDRKLLLTPEFLKKVGGEYENQNVLMDYIERIPLRRPESVAALLSWQEGLMQLGQADRQLFTALGQALLETIAQAAGFSPQLIDFDAVVQDFASITWTRPALFDGLFAFIARRCGAATPRDITATSYLEFILSGLRNQEVVINGEAYEWRVRDSFLSDLGEMLESQEPCQLSALGEINELLAELVATPADSAGPARRLREAVAQLPYPDFSQDAPKILRERVMPFAKEDLDRDLRDLLRSREKGAPPESIRKAIAAFKGAYLLPLAEDHFLALAYALNAKSPKLRMFMNPNLARLHDFSDSGPTPWETGSAPGHKADFSGYYLRGGLSRLNLTFATNWRNQLFEKNIFNAEQTQAMISNIMALLPQPAGLQGAALDALLVELAVEMLPKYNEVGALANALLEAAMARTAGYHYRKLSDFLDNRADDYHLFFTELRQVGMDLADVPAILERFSKSDDLERFRQLPLSAVIAEENDSWGNIFFNSFGSLAPRANPHFPQEVSQLFASGFFSGEALAEYKVKTAYLAYKNDLPACLIGQFVFDFISTSARAIYSQNHVKDYHSTHFVLDIMNSAHVRATLKKLQKNDFLRLR